MKILECDINTPKNFPDVEPENVNWCDRSEVDLGQCATCKKAEIILKKVAMEKAQRLIPSLLYQSGKVELHLKITPKVMHDCSDFSIRSGVFNGENIDTIL